MPTKFNDRYLTELGHSAKVEAVVVEAAERVAATARATARVDTGEYRESIHVEVRHSKHRVIAVVVADAPHSLAEEAVTGNLARALGANSIG